MRMAGMVLATCKRRAKGATRSASYTEMCGDLRACPSNLRDCYPISGWQHESAAGGGNDGVYPTQAVGR
jgi:hypothetical protein